MRLTSRVRLVSAYPWNSHASTMWSRPRRIVRTKPQNSRWLQNHRSAEALDMDLDTRSFRTLSEATSP